MFCYSFKIEIWIVLIGIAQAAENIRNSTEQP